MHSKTLIILAALYSALSLPVAKAAEWSANLGYNSDYIYRGIPQKSNSLFGGVDFGHGGWYAGTWAADVGDGAEVDFYGGYSFEVGEEWSFVAGSTLYTYTGDFDDTYREVNLGASWRFLSFDAAVGQYNNFGGPELYYQFYSLTAEYNGLYGKVGTFEDDFDGSYYEAGYGNTLRFRERDIVDYAFAVIYSDATLLGGKSDTNVVLALSKTFDF